MKYISPVMKVVTEDQLKEIISAHANSDFNAGGCVYFGALSSSDYLCSVGSIAGY